MSDLLPYQCFIGADMIKLIALDLDNTLLSKDNNIPSDVLSLLRECMRRRITIVIATGRMLNSALKYAKEIGNDCKILCYNGSLIISSDGHELFSAALTTDIMEKIVIFSKSHGLYCQFYKDHKILVEKVTEGTTIDPDLLNTEALEVGDFSNYEFEPSPKAMIVVKPEDLHRLQSELSEFLGKHVYLAQSQSYLIEIMPENINKANSLAFLCEKLGISPDEVMACGDNTNDAEMLKWAGLGVAISNSVESLKAVADYVCQNERSAGVAEAIKKFCL